MYVGGDEMKTQSEEIWVAETRVGNIVGYVIFSRKTGQVIRSIRYA